jgi:hypothetical protein
MGKRSRMTCVNIAMAKDVLFGTSLSRAATMYGVSRGRAWQVTRAFCLAFFLPSQVFDDNGRVKGLEELRRVWADMPKI